MTQEFVTLPREVVEQAIRSLERYCFDVVVTKEVHAALRAALDQPQNHVPDAGNMAPAGWKLVPVEPTKEMLDAYVRLQARFNSARSDWAAMLAAAPLPPAPDQPQAEQPAMTPIAQRKLDSLLTEGYTISGYSVYHEQKHQHGFVTGAGLVGWWRPEGMEYPQPKGEQEPVVWQYRMRPDWGSQKDCWGPWQDCTMEQAAMYQRVPLLHDWAYESRQLYTHPQNLNCKSNQARLATLWGYTKEQPKREPLTDEAALGVAKSIEIQFDSERLNEQIDDILAFARAIEAAHNIK